MGWSILAQFQCPPGCLLGESEIWHKHLSVSNLPFAEITKSVSFCPELQKENRCFMSQMSQWVISRWVNESGEKNKSLVETIKLGITFIYFVYLLHCCLHMQGLFLTWNLNLGCLLAVSQDQLLLLCACPKNSLPRHPLRTIYKTIRQSIQLEVPYQKWSAAPRMFILVPGGLLLRILDRGVPQRFVNPNPI